MSITNDEPLMGREEGRKLYEEADKLLSLAEKLEEVCEQYERRWGVTRALFQITIAAGAAAAVSFTYNTIWSWAVFMYVLTLVAVIDLCYLTVKTRRHLARERRALHSIVDILRGLEKGIAEKNNLSALERAAFRIRLSRFDIGPG
jgi:hypothetical protein